MIKRMLIKPDIPVIPISVPFPMLSIEGALF